MAPATDNVTSAPNLRMQNVRLANGISLEVLVAGPAGGSPIIFLHGFPEYGGAWKKQLEYFGSRGYFAIAPNQRGYGHSDKPGRVSGYRIQNLVDDVKQLAAAMAPQRAFDVVGHDWGGVVAWNLAREPSPELRKVAIMNAPDGPAFRAALRHDRQQRRRSRYIAFFQLPVLPELWLSLGRFAALKRSLRKTSRPGTFSADFTGYEEAWSVPGALRSMLNWYRAARGPGGREATPASEPGRITLPLLLLWGERDAFLGRELGPRSLASCENGRLLSFPEATHWLHHEFADAVSEELYAFLTEQS